VNPGQAHPPRPGRDRRWRSWLALGTAAAAAAALVIALVIINESPNGPAAAPATGASPAPAVSATPSGSSGTLAGENAVPGYYVALMPAGKPYLDVSDTFTGQRIATVAAPAGVTLGGVYGAADEDRTFIVAGDRLSGAKAATAWYLLLIAPQAKTRARLTPLPIPVSQRPAGIALSPDGTEVAVAIAGSPAALRVYSVPTGGLLREWTATAPGEITAEKGQPGSWPFTAVTLRWSSDGRQLAFTWSTSAIRVLDATAPDGDLITGSRPLGAIGTAYASLGSFTCRAAQGWHPITITAGAEAGQGVVCAGSDQTDIYTPCTSPTDTTCKYTQRNSIGFLRATQDSQGDSYQGFDVGSDCPSLNQPGNGAYLGWSNSDGSELIGAELCAGRSSFGIFRGKTFTPLPALSAPLPLSAALTDGTIAW
jgi:hypothetical protein